MMDNNKGRMNVYGNVVNDKLEINPDGTLDLILAVTTGEKDRIGEFVDPVAFDMIAEQLPKQNLHLDHIYSHKCTIGSIPSAMVDTENDRILITTKILPEPAKDIKQRYDIGMHLGASLGADFYYDPNNPKRIYKVDVVDVSLTHMPINQNTLDTITQKKHFAGTCITDACKRFIDYLDNISIKSMKNNNKNKNNIGANNMANPKQQNNPPADDAGFDIDKFMENIGEFVDSKIDDRLKNFGDGIEKTFDSSLSKIFDAKFGEFESKINGLFSNEPQDNNDGQPSVNQVDNQNPVNNRPQLNQNQQQPNPVSNQQQMDSNQTGQVNGVDVGVFGQKSMAGLQNINQDEIINGIYNLLKQDLMNNNSQQNSLLKRFEQKSMHSMQHKNKRPTYRDEYGRVKEYL